MFVYSLAFLLGVISVQQLAILPEASTLLLLFVCVCLTGFTSVLVFRERRPDLKSQYTLIVYLILLLLLGFLYACYSADRQLSLRLDEHLTGKNIIVNGRVSSIPVADGKVQRFEFLVESHRLLSDEEPTRTVADFPEKIRLSWYYGRQVNAGERWQLLLRLKPPHGFMNPGGFDYEAWLFQHGIQATGYVRKSKLNRREAVAADSVNSLRQSLSRRIDALARRSSADEGHAFSLVKALAVGDKYSISGLQWRVLANTGTSHLMAISGLHIGLASMFAYVLIRRLVPAFVMKHMPAQHVALLGGLLVASLYALLAGLSIPTQRAIIMLFVLSLMLLTRRNHRPLDALGFALFVVLLIDPVAVLSAGFWFSFSAVAVIFISISTAQKQVGPGELMWLRAKAVLMQWLRLQLLISLFLLPLSLFMFQQVSLISPVANLLLIPYVSFLVVPVVLLAVVASFLWLPLSDMFFTLAANLLDFIWPLLSSLAALPYALWVRGDVGIIELLAATAALLLLFYIRSIRQRFDRPVTVYVLGLLVCLLFAPLWMTDKTNLAEGDFQLTVLDVGQGSAAVIQTRDHVMVFDSGAKFSDRLNAGSGVVIPFLRTQGISVLDRLIISHGDADHIGGAQAILDEYPEVFLIGQDIEPLHAGHRQPCEAGLKWHWDGVDFVFLSPDEEIISLSRKGRRNNHSCVLQVRSKSGSVLLTGDIEKDIEQWLLEKYGSQLASDVLIVPHHGSNTSSSTAFIRVVDPEISLISVGYKNRYRLPSRRVTARYETQQRDFLQTDSSGAIILRLSQESGLGIVKYREQAARYWHHVLR